MKISLAGKLSILIALYFPLAWLTLESAGPAAYHVQIATEKVAVFLSFPILWVYGFVLGHTDGASSLEVGVGLVLLIPNSILLGHLVAGLIEVLWRGRKRSSIPPPDLASHPDSTHRS